jgi:hypothetical protein
MSCYLKYLILFIWFNVGSYDLYVNLCGLYADPYNLYIVYAIYMHSENILKIENLIDSQLNSKLEVMLRRIR